MKLAEPNKMLPIQPGTKVRVNNGQMEPPARFKNKQREWRANNYDAVVVGEEEAGPYRLVPMYRVQKCGDWDGIMLVFATVNPDNVAILDGAERYIVKNDGMDNIVAGVAG